ncbi:MAG TPA: MFS transporter [Stellaceae bacterium]|nr:MFS transporter [Stellaceae bacterium]
MTRSVRYENTLIGLMFLTFGTIFLDRMAQFYLAPYLIPDLHVNNIQIGMMASVLALAWAVSSLVFGVICDRYGRRVILVPAVFAFSLMSWLTGVVETFGQMLLVRFLLGIAEGACYAPVMAVAEAASSPHRRGINVGIVVTAAAFVGQAVAPVLTTQVAAYIGWRWSFFVAGVPGVILGFFIWKYVEEPIVRKGEEQRPKLGEFLTLLKYPNMVLCCFAGAANLTAIFFFQVFAPLYITQIAHEAPTTAGFIIGASGVGGGVAGILYPALSDRIGRKPVLLFASLVAIFFPLALLIPALYQNLWALAAIEFLFSTNAVIPSLVMVVIPTESVPSKLAATAIGATTLTSELIGAAIAPTIGGIFAQRMGLAVPIEIAAGMMVIVFLLCAMLRETHARKLVLPSSAPAQ